MIATTRDTPAFTGWLDDFFTAYYHHRPVNATFIGRHEYDNYLPDFSRSGIEAAQAAITDLRIRLTALPAEPLSEAQLLDRQLAAGFLDIAVWEYGSGHFLRRNPTVFTGEAIFGVLSLFLRPFAPFPERVAGAVERLRAVPAFLEQAPRIIHSAPAAWTGRARRECAGFQLFLRHGIAVLAEEAPAASADALRTAAVGAAQAFSEFDAWLDGELSARSDDNYGCGAEALDLLVRRGHFLSQSVADLEQHALAVLDETEAYLQEHAPDFGVASPAEALAQLADIHPTADQYYGRYGEVWAAMRAEAERHRLLSWPDYPIRFVPQPVWAREAAPSLYFLFYRSPAPFEFLLPPDDPVQVEYLVTPIDADMPEAEQERRLRATNDSVIKLNHVIHHGGIGHQVQNWHAFHAKSRIGQIAGVDCASRIAMFCGGTMTEGWACYATEVMDEIGFLTPLERYAERHTRLRMAARTIADIRLHQGRWSLNETAAFYTETVGMAPAAAHGEAVKNSMFPGTALMYLAGTDMIHQLRRDLRQREGAAFDLAAFHDRFLSYGSVPVALIAQQLLRPDDPDDPDDPVQAVQPVQPVQVADSPPAERISHAQ